MDSKKMYVMFCDEDDSHTIVPDKDVIYARGTSVLMPGEAAYFYDGGKKWRGVVKDIGTDFNTLVKSRDTMNAKKPPKRNLSFHADQPRRAKLKCNEAFGVRQTSSKSTSAFSSTKASIDTTQRGEQSLKDRPSTSKGRHTSPKDELSNLSEKHSNNSQPKSMGNTKGVEEEMEVQSVDLLNEDSTDDPLTELEIQALAKLAQKKKRADLKELTTLAVKVSRKSGNTDEDLFGRDSPVKSRRNFVSSDSDSDQASSSKPQKKTTKDVIGTITEKPKTADTIKSDEDSCDSNNENKSSPSSPKITKKRSKPRSTFVNPKLQFTGEYFLHKETDPDVVKLHEDYEVYVPEKVIKEVKRNSSINTTTALARHIVKQVFTKDALQQCSVFGRPSACKGAESMTCRPALHKDGVQAIIKFVLNRAEKKKWKGAVRSSVTAAMANIICEGRDLIKLEEKADKTA